MAHVRAHPPDPAGAGGWLLCGAAVATHHGGAAVPRTSRLRHAQRPASSSKRARDKTSGVGEECVWRTGELARVVQRVRTSNRCTFRSSLDVVRAAGGCKQREYLCSPRSTIRLQVGKHALCASPQASAQLPRLTRDSGEEALVFGFWCTRKTHVARRDIGLCGDCITTVTTAACT